MRRASPSRTIVVPRHLAGTSAAGGEISQRGERGEITGVVAGISHYGNCIGVPTIGGEVYFVPALVAIIGCAALYPFPNDSAGELACLAVEPDFRRDGYGAAIAAEIEQRAKAAGLKRLFVLTTKSAHWFVERGYAGAGCPAGARSSGEIGRAHV